MSTISDESIQSYINSLDKTDFACKRVFGAFSVNNKQEIRSIPIGIAHLSIIDDTNKVAEVSISVDAQYRRLGVGTALINQVVTYTQEIGYLTLTMSCS
ncbi:MAG: GNAT family N-acetyltransferase, partial [Chlamydiota bacterium]